MTRLGWAGPMMWTSAATSTCSTRCTGTCPLLLCRVTCHVSLCRRVQDTPQEIPFLSILQHLLRIDPKEAVSDIIWDTAVWSGEIKIFVGKHKNISGDAGAPRHADGEQGGQ